MNRDQAYATVRETFTKSFDKKRFQSFALNLLNHLDESKAESRNSQYIKEAFKSHVRRYERLGTYTSPNKEKLDVLIIYVTDQSKLERARTAIRNFVADHLKLRDEKDAALVAFVSPDEKSWRLSYVKMEYEALRENDGKISVQTRLTPARRFSYLVGEGESCHTAQTRFLNLLQDTDKDPLLSNIQEAFSVEAVTKEFFIKYVELFENINKELEKLITKEKLVCEEFERKHVSTIEFAKKLMGQIVFLYFLQKKGWLGVAKGNDWGTGPHDFLRRLAKSEYGEYSNFFNEVLEPLFYDTLATDRGHEAWCNRFKCRIPFLNGGLFEPVADYNWRRHDIKLPNKLFHNRDLVEEGIYGTGILDVFDRYNFTVNEAEPLEKEVAIDPEMLGKVFENLIEENRRKGLGAYYTPREIVHYMCREALINYLDNAINSADKPILSGTPKQSPLFSENVAEQSLLMTSRYSEIIPRHDIETFIHIGEQISHYEAVDTQYPIKMPKAIQKNSRLIDEKLTEIRICDPAVGSGAFPVGMMTEIVRARSTLTPYFNDPHERTAYQFKRHAIQNCLYGVDIDATAVEIAKLRLWLSLVVDEEDVKHIKPLPNLEYKIVSGNSLMGFPFKSQRLQDIEKLKLKFFDEPDHNAKAKLKKQIDQDLNACFADAKKSLGYEVTFDFEIWFSEVFEQNPGFDVVIANPPYVRQEGIKELKPVLKNQFQCYTGTADLYVYFFERSVKLLKNGGILAFITSNKYFRAGYGEKLRAFLAKQTLHQVIDFGDAPVFTATSYPSIVILTKQQRPQQQTRVMSWQPGPPIEDFAREFQARSFYIPQKELSPDGWQLESPSALRLLEKLRKSGRPLGEYVGGRFYRGIVTGLNEAFIVDRVTRDRLIADDERSAEILKPFLRGRDLKRWKVESHDLWLLFIPWHFPLQEDSSILGGSATAEKEFSKKYPAVYAHLENFKTELSSRNAVETGTRYEWYALQRWAAKYWKEFQQPKILYPDIYEHQSFAWDERGYFAGNTCYFIPTKEKWLTALLNSQLIEWFYSKITNKVRGGYMRSFSDYICQIPIPALNEQKKSNLLEIVDRILIQESDDIRADVSGFEHELDALVCTLYGLSDGEIAIIEESYKAGKS
jgi:type I restriction-modification system DNA methylase subunit